MGNIREDDAEIDIEVERGEGGRERDGSGESEKKWEIEWLKCGSVNKKKACDV